MAVTVGVMDVSQSRIARVALCLGFAACAKGSAIGTDGAGGGGGGGGGGDAGPPGSGLSVVKAGTGDGVISSTDGDIACGATCTASYDDGATVTLSVQPAASSTFVGWSGACTGATTCNATVNGPTTVTATFAAGPEMFTYTGAPQTYTVPGQTHSIKVEAWGAAGVDFKGATAGGLGGYASGVMAVTPGQQLLAYVGGQAQWNGGGAGATLSTPVPNGGDASDVRTAADISTRVIVAGGGGAGGVGDAPGDYLGGAGGGGTCGVNYCGGAGGTGFLGANGLPGGNVGGTATTAAHAGGGGGGGATSGGAPSCETYHPPSTCGTAGVLGQGGAGDPGQEAIEPVCFNADGGTAGGGGGYFGGGGSSVGYCGGGGGGGGSSWTGTLTESVMTPGVQAGTGKIVITPIAP